MKLGCHELLGRAGDFGLNECSTKWGKCSEEKQANRKNRERTVEELCGLSGECDHSGLQESTGLVKFRRKASSPC